MVLVAPLPIPVITKQLDCCTAKRINGSTVVTEGEPLTRPSATAKVPKGRVQRFSDLLALTLLLPPAEPDTKFGLPPVWTPGCGQPVKAKAARQAVIVFMG